MGNGRNISNIERAKKILSAYDGRPLRIMEVCGTHTHEIFRQGIRDILGKNIRLVSGPGCPVCVTGGAFIDEACYLAEEIGVTVCTFGDLLRVPGSRENLDEVRSRGGAVRIVYTPLDAVTYAKEHPSEQVVFLSVGFETTTPSSCLAVRHAQEMALANFSLLTANKTMDEAYKSLAGSADAFLYPGHVCAITGTKKLTALAEEQGISGAVAGFKAEEILLALVMIVQKVAAKRPFMVNCYPRVVSEDGSIEAQKLLAEYLEPCDSLWRGLGNLTGSGLQLRPAYRSYDARLRFNLPDFAEKMPPGCRCGDVLKGNIEPQECKLFGTACSPLHPIGACMVSQEGTCAAYYKYRR